MPRKAGQHKSPHPWQGAFRRRGKTGGRVEIAAESVERDVAPLFDAESERELVDHVRGGGTFSVLGIPAPESEAE